MNSPACNFSVKFDMDVLRETMKSLAEIPRGPSPLGTVVLTHRQAGELRRYAGDKFCEGANFKMAAGHPTQICGLDVAVIEPVSRMIRTGEIIQKDRFAEYDADDMAWAEPLGLAEWEMVDREKVIFEMNARLAGMGSMARCTGFAMTGPNTSENYSSAKSDEAMLRKQMGCQ